MIVVVDYGSGNLRSVSKALEHLGAEVEVSGAPETVAKAQRVVLPGVGTFKDAMNELDRRALTDVLRAHIEAGKPFLGICLGLQLLFDESEENPGIAGLGIIGGKVSRFRSKGVKIPHMGWNRVDFCNEHPLLANVLNSSFFYFVHSYYGIPENPDWITGFCEYGQERVTAIVAEKNVFATQFHPEKSQGAGLQILKNFIHWEPSK